MNKNLLILSSVIRTGFFLLFWVYKLNPMTAEASSYERKRIVNVSKSFITVWFEIIDTKICAIQRHFKYQYKIKVKNEMKAILNFHMDVLFIHLFLRSRGLLENLFVAMRTFARFIRLNTIPLISLRHRLFEHEDFQFYSII